MDTINLQQNQLINNPMPLQIPLTVIIPTMNRPESLHHTIQSLTTGNYIPNEIIIIDQSTHKNTIEKNQYYINKQLSNIGRYFYLETPSSTRARNIGLEHSSNDLIIFSDDDIEIYNDTIEKIYKIMISSDISMLGAIDDHTTYTDSFLGYISGIRSFSKRNIGNISLSCFGRYPKNIIKRVKTEWCMGYFFAIKKSLTSQWNIKWDENLISYAYAEDLDFSYTYYKYSQQNHLQCILDKDIHVKHLATKEYRVPSKKSTYMLILHRYYLIHKHKMGVQALLTATYSNIFLFIERLLKKEAPFDIIKAMIIWIINRKKINNGQISSFLK